MRIDAHQHFWKYNPLRDAWIDDTMQVLRQDFLPKDIETLLKKHSLDGCVAVQADQTEQETRFLLDLADQNNFVKKVIGWTDLAAPDIVDRLESWKQHEKLAGFRHILQSEPPEKMQDRRFRNGISKLAACGFTYDILIYPAHLTAAMELVDKFPYQPFVLDHLAKPLIRKGERQPWQKQITELAKRPNVFCKLSGLVTEANLSTWQPADLQPFIEIGVEAFGPARMMFGSDWPVCLLAANYTQVIAAVEEYAARLSSAERERIMGGTARDFYGITN